MFHGIQSLCKVSQDYSVLANQPEAREKAATILRSAEWGRRLGKMKGKMKVSYTKAFRGDISEKRKVASLLLRKPQADLDTVIQYCW